MDQKKLEIILGRKEHTDFIDFVSYTYPQYYADRPILVTGGNGSLGNALADWFDKHGIRTYHLLDINTDNNIPGRRIHKANILKSDDMQYWVNNTKAEFVFHFAAAKHAPIGEEDPWNTMMINVEGTQNIIRALDGFGGEDSNLILSSTCKSCMPETCYGASKLIAERLTLNAGHTVARYFNVVQSSGNVFEIWDNQEAPYVATNCSRYFISIDEAIALTVFAGTQKGNRLIISPGDNRYMPDICNDLYDDVIVKERRRGDRLIEPIHAFNEEAIEFVGPIFKIENFNDHSM